MPKKPRKSKTLNVEELNLEAIMRNAEEVRRRFFFRQENKTEKPKRIFRKEATFISR